MARVHRNAAPARALLRFADANPVLYDELADAGDIQEHLIDLIDLIRDNRQKGTA